MSSLLSKFSLTAVRFNAQMGMCALLIWCVVLGCALSSIFSQPFNKRQRFFWVFLVIAFPLVGVLSYLPFSFRKEDMPHIFLPKSKKTGRRGSSKSPVIAS